MTAPDAVTPTVEAELAEALIRHNRFRVIPDEFWWGQARVLAPIVARHAALAAQAALRDAAEDVLTAWHDEMVPERVTQEQVAAYLRRRADAIPDAVREGES